MDWPFLYDTLLKLIVAIPLSLQLALFSICAGLVLALILAMMSLSPYRLLRWPAVVYIFVFRGTPLLVQLFIVYYALSQFSIVRNSIFWPVLREPYWCAIISLALCTAAYSAEIIRGGILSVPKGQIEAAKAYGMTKLLMYRRVILPLATRQALPAYSNEVISMVKATSLASTITLTEMMGITAQIISGTYRAIEVLLVAGILYLIINFTLLSLLACFESYLSPQQKPSRLFALFSLFRQNKKVESNG